MQMKSDNKKMMRVLTKDNLIVRNVMQDAGELLGEIWIIKSALKVEFEYIHCSGDVEKPST